MNLLGTKSQGEHLLFANDTLAKLYEREQAAIMICGGQLGNCFLLGEVIDSMITDLMPQMRECPWFRQTIKHDFNQAVQMLKKTNRVSMANSPSKGDFMREIADQFYDVIKSDLFRMEQAVRISLGKHKVPNDDVMARIINVHIMLQMVKTEYESVVEYMMTLWGDKEFYQSWYGHASYSNVMHWWSKGLYGVATQIVAGTINLNEFVDIRNGVEILRRRLHDNTISDRIRTATEDECGVDPGSALYQNALKVMGVA